jgi:hypothetical protein
VDQPALRRPASHPWRTLHSISVTWPDGRGPSSYLQLIGRRRATSPRVRVGRAAIVAAAAAPTRHRSTAASHSVKKARPGSSKYGTSTPRPPPQWVIEPSTRACTSKLSTTRAAQPATTMAARRRWRKDVPSHRQTQPRMRTTEFDTAPFGVTRPVKHRANTPVPQWRRVPDRRLVARVLSARSAWNLLPAGGRGSVVLGANPRVPEARSVRR